MSRLQLILIVTLAGILALGGALIFASKQKGKPLSEAFPMRINNATISVELATTPAAQERGLGGRRNLPENQGMLFLYDKAARYSFWMKNMQFPIDIIWIDENKRVVDITKNLSPATFPNTFQPTKPARYILEVNAGFADRNAIAIGNAVDLSRIPAF